MKMKMKITPLPLVNVWGNRGVQKNAHLSD